MPYVTPLRPDDPRRVGRYRLAGRIADDVADPDALGTFLSRMPDGTPVAVTLLARASAPDPASRDRFTAEARAARRVAPFCTARILDAGFDTGQPYLISEFIEGPSLAEAVGTEGAFGGAVLAALATGAATGLASIHQAGLVHGDFSPDHVVLGAEGPRVVKFSITPPYGSATPSADLQAWARTVMFAASGGGIRPADPASLPEPLRNVVAACLSGDPVSRPPARALVTALLGQSDPAVGLLAEGTRRARAAGRGAVATGSRAAPEEPARSRYRRVAWIAGVAACVAAIVVAATLLVTQRAAQHDAVRATAPARASTSAHTSPVPPPPAPKIPAALAGTWSGMVRQTQPDLAVTVQIQLAAGASTGTVAYQQLGCSGRLLLVSAHGGRYTLQQGITRGQQNCESGVVLLTPQGRSGLVFRFRRTGAPSPSGVLARTGP
jgi:eukaryotic-like serine/threonine-protein kinase